MINLQIGTRSDFNTTELTKLEYDEDDDDVPVYQSGSEYDPDESYDIDHDRKDTSCRLVTVTVPYLSNKILVLDFVDEEIQRYLTGFI